jgi:histidinol-phosphate aminotransferase
LSTALTVGGPGSSFVFSDPSFVMYPIYAAITGAEPVAVPAGTGLGHDLDAMLEAIRPDTTLIFVCNPNNPSGTHVPYEDLVAFIDEVPERTLVVVDEAYSEFATAADYATGIPLAIERDNVIVARTFSKVFGLAGLRVGYAVGRPEVLSNLRRGQLPFSVNAVAQAAAVAALGCLDQLQQRVIDNAVGRQQLEKGLADLGVDYLPSQTNFVLLTSIASPAAVADVLLRRGIIVRTLGPYLRVTVGTTAENERFLAALEEARTQA